MMGRKLYHSIGHISSSKLGPGDHFIDARSEHCLLEALKEPRNDIVTVQEKLDGSCGVVTNDLTAWGRAGYPAVSSPFPPLQTFHQWVVENQHSLARLELGEDERAVGEWLGVPHGIRYKDPSSPFVIFDIIRGKEPISHAELVLRVGSAELELVPTVHRGNPLPLSALLSKLGAGLYCSAQEPPEGLVFKYERKGRQLFRAKYVRHDFIPGKYFTREDQ